MLRKYWFEIFHFALWILVGALLFFQQFIGLPAALFAITVCAVAFAMNALHGQAMAAFRILAAPLAMLVVVLPLQRSSALNWVEFSLVKNIFQAKVRDLPRADGEPRLIGFHMDDRGWQAIGPKLFEPRTYVNGDYVIETLVFDESDEIAQPPEQRSQEWHVRAIGRPHFHSILQPVTANHRVAITDMGQHWFWVEQVFAYLRPPS